MCKIILTVLQIGTVSVVAEYPRFPEGYERTVEEEIEAAFRTTEALGLAS